MTAIRKTAIQKTNVEKQSQDDAQVKKDIEQTRDKIIATVPSKTPIYDEVLEEHKKQGKL